MKTLSITICIFLFGAFSMYTDKTTSNHFSNEISLNQRETIHHQPSNDPMRKKEPEVNQLSIKQHIETILKFFFAKNERTPANELPFKQTKLDQILQENPDQLLAAWLGHSALLLNIDGHTILTDPVFERKVSVVGPTRFNSKMPLNIDSLPSIDTVLISHNHYDHLNKYSIKKLSAKASRFVVPMGVGRIIEKWGVPGNKIIELKWWQEVKLDNTLTLAATPAQHFSGRGLTDRNTTLWASWVIMTPNHRLFFSGDSGYFDGFKRIGETYGPFDVTFLECGAYNESWSDVHMFPEETVQAHIDLKGKRLQPIHWSTFNLSLHPWYEPMERLVAEANKMGVNISTPVAGEIINYQSFIKTTHWWRDSMKKEKSFSQNHTIVKPLSQT